MSLENMEQVLAAFAKLSNEEKKIVRAKIGKTSASDSVDKYYMPEKLKSFLGEKDERFLKLYDLSTLWLSDYMSLLNDDNISAGRRAAKMLIDLKKEIPSRRKLVYDMMKEIASKRKLQAAGKPRKTEPAAFKAARERRHLKLTTSK